MAIKLNTYHINQAFNSIMGIWKLGKDWAVVCLSKAWLTVIYNFRL